MARSPFEIIAGPAQVFIADVGEAFPDTDEDPTAVGAWTDLGRTEGGITVRHTQSVELLMTDQLPGPVKPIRSEEGLEIEFQLAELTIENYAKVLNDKTVSAFGAAGGTPGFRKIDLHRGLDVQCNALLVRGPSPLGDFNMQFEVPVVAQIEEPETVFVRDDKAVLAVNYTAIEDLTKTDEDERFGCLRAQETS